MRIITANEPSKPGATNVTMTASRVRLEASWGRVSNA